MEELAIPGDELVSIEEADGEGEVVASLLDPVLTSTVDSVPDPLLDSLLDSVLYPTVEELATVGDALEVAAKQGMS